MRGLRILIGARQLVIALIHLREGAANGRPVKHGGASGRSAIGQVGPMATARIGEGASPGATGVTPKSRFIQPSGVPLRPGVPDSM